MSPARWTTLPCGVDPERLVTHAAERSSPQPDSHEANCGYCRAAIAELADLWEPIGRWAKRDFDMPERFVATLMSRVRRLVQSPRHVAVVSARGTTMVTSWVLGLIASNATLRTEGVAAITGSRPPGDVPTPVAMRYGADGVDIDEVGAAAVSVALGLTAGPVNSLVDLAEAVRRNVIGAIAAQTTIEAAVDVSVDGLL